MEGRADHPLRRVTTRRSQGGMREMRRSRVGIAAATVLLCASGAWAQEGYRIIVNPANPTSTLSKAQVSNLFLRRTVSWDDGRSVAPVDQTDAAVREAFARDVLGM